MNNEKVPLDKVLEDMYTDSGIESSAREYYYNEYATDEEREEMDREDKATIIFGVCLFVIIFLMLIGMILYRIIIG